jgi:hypothetical protein
MAISSLRGSCTAESEVVRWVRAAFSKDGALQFVTPFFFLFFFLFLLSIFFLDRWPPNLSRIIIAFLLGQAIQGNIQFSGYVLSLPAVGPPSN